MIDLFAAMDSFAAKHLLDTLHSETSNRIHFDGLIRLHRPDLAEEERSTLYQVWLEHHLCQLRDQLATLRGDLAEQDQARRNLLFGGKQGGRAFWCACGEMVPDAFDFETIRKHRPHMMAVWNPPAG